MSLQHHLMVRISWLLLVDTTGSTIMRYLLKSYIRFSTTTLVSFGVINGLLRHWIMYSIDSHYVDKFQIQFIFSYKLLFERERRKVTPPIIFSLDIIPPS